MAEKGNHFLDLYRLDQDLLEHQKIIADRIHKFVDLEILPNINEWTIKGIFPKELINKIAQLGLLEGIVSGELDAVSYGLMMRELERGGSTVRSLISVQRGLVLYPVMTFGSKEQKEKWIEPLSTLKKIGCFGLTEPDFGSNPGGMRTRAQKTDKGYVIHGTKCWITNGTYADVAIIWAKYQDEIRGFIVETSTPGFIAKEIENKWSFRASDTAEIFLDNVEVPATAILPSGKGLGAPLKCLTQARYGIAWGVIGAARACLQETVQYLLERPQFDNKPLASHQLIQGKLAWMVADLTGMELIAMRLAELKEKNQMTFEQVSLAKMNNCRKALEIARKCRELLGAAGIVHEHHIGRHMLDLETVITYEGTEHIHQLVLGDFITGIRSYF